MMAILFFFVLILAHMLAFTAVSGKPFSFANASEAVTFSQSIRPIDPVETTEPLKQKEKQIKKLNSVNFRMITPLGEETSDLPPSQADTIKTLPVVTFSGTSLYPNSQVFLSLHSDPFFSSTLSDNQGNWSWTNYGQPLEIGNHTIEAYSIAPIEVSGKRDVFAQKYFFSVINSNDFGGSGLVSLGNSNYKEKGGDDDLGERILENRLESTYVFNVVLPDKTVYGPGENMNVELLFSPLGNGTHNKANIEYAIFAINNEGVIDSQSTAEFSDQAELNDGGYFVKSIKLKENLMPGNYAMMIKAKIGKDLYHQSFKFDISAKTIMTIGSNVITTEKFGQVMVFNVIFIVAILVGLISLVMVEFRRFMVYRSIDENFLRRKGYFTK